MANFDVAREPAVAPDMDPFDAALGIANAKDDTWATIKQQNQADIPKLDEVGEKDTKEELTRSQSSCTGLRRLNMTVQLALTKAPNMLGDEESLESAIRGIAPTKHQAQLYRQAFEATKALVTESPVGEASSAFGRARSSLIMVPVGSYGLGVWLPGTSIDCVCIGPLSSQTFSTLAVQRIQRASVQSSHGPKISRRVRTETGLVLELEVHGVVIKLHYAAATQIAEQWPGVLRLPAADPVFASLPAQTQEKLRSIRDLLYIRESTPDIERFCLAHRAVRSWAEARGIYSAKFGYLGGIQISILLGRVFKILASTYGRGISAADLVASFFTHYASFDWKREMAFDPFFHNPDQLKYRRLEREPLVILGFYPPSLNTTRSATASSARALSQEFRLAREAMLKNGTSWHELISGSWQAEDRTRGSEGALRQAGRLPQGAADFLRSYKLFLRISVQYWNLSLPRGSQFISWLESQCPLLLADIYRRLPSLNYRIWPKRFMDVASPDDLAEETSSNDTREYQGFYLVGLERETKASEEEDRAEAGAMQTILRGFEELVRSKERHFDLGTQWVCASLVKAADLGEELAMDDRDLSHYTIGEDEDVEEEEEEEEEEKDEKGRNDHQEAEGAHPKKKDRESAKTPQNEEDTVMMGSKPSVKFRTASDVMNRLRWDSSLDSSDYIIGYEDRFKGIMERALDAWKSEQTDEDFIPQHRILYFKRKDDGGIIWERRTRRDELFSTR